MSHLKSKEMSGWDQVIEGSEEMLGKIEAKAKRLRTNIEVAKEAKRSGEPWPGSQPDNQTSDSCHSI